MPFNGINPHSVVIMDNCLIHHVPEVVKTITDVGALVHFLPPYSPDLNPIEETFSEVESLLKAYDDTLLQIQDTETLLLLAFNEITKEDCDGWIRHSEMYHT